MPKRPQLRVLDAARLVVADINRWLNTAAAHVPDSVQIREAARSITANIREAYGREPGPDRNKFLRYARGSAEETDERLHGAMKDGFLDEPRYWSKHNRLAVIVRMLTSLMKRPVN